MVFASNSPQSQQSKKSRSLISTSRIPSERLAGYIRLLDISVPPSYVGLWPDSPATFTFHSNWVCPLVGPSNCRK